MTDPPQLVADRVEQLLTEADPHSTDPVSFRRRQYELGLAWVHFPEGFGGLGVLPQLQREVDRRTAAAGAKPHGFLEFFGLAMAGPTIVTHGSDELKRRLLPRMFTGEDSWCQLFSEPGAGSDLAGLSTRAVRDGDEWVVSGQKVWNTLAHVAQRGMLVTRTDPDAPKHKGLTYFALDMHAPGVEVRPLAQMTGEAEFNEVYLTDVRVPDADRIGDLGDGWRVVDDHVHERAHLHRGEGAGLPPRGSGPIAEAVRIWAEEATATNRTPVMRDRLMRMWTEAEVLRLTNLRAAQGPTRRQPGAGGVDRQAHVRRGEHADLRVLRRPARSSAGSSTTTTRCGGANTSASSDHRDREEDVHPLPGQLDRRRDLGDPAQHPR